MMTAMEYELTETDREWIEAAYAELEKMEGFKRPHDYIERMRKILSGHFRGRRNER